MLDEAVPISLRLSKSQTDPQIFLKFEILASLWNTNSLLCFKLQQSYPYLLLATFAYCFYFYLDYYRLTTYDSYKFVTLSQPIATPYSSTATPPSHHTVQSHSSLSQSSPFLVIASYTDAWQFHFPELLCARNFYSGETTKKLSSICRGLPLIWCSWCC